jgi:hypothetical protein
LSLLEIRNLKGKTDCEFEARSVSKKKKIANKKPGVVVHACNPSCSESGEEWED